jgi:hypothetical protein
MKYVLSRTVEVAFDLDLPFLSFPGRNALWTSLILSPMLSQAGNDNQLITKLCELESSFPWKVPKVGLLPYENV